MLKILNCWKYDPDGSFQDFWNFSEVDFGHDPKTCFDHHDLLSHETITKNN
jgi:hypothetical protein